MSQRSTILLLAPILLALGCEGWDDASATNKDGESDEQRRGRIATNAVGGLGIADPTMGDGGRAPVMGQGGGGERQPLPEPEEEPDPEAVPDADPGKEPWVVLSNFRKQSQGIQTFGETYRVDYKFAEGRPGDTATFLLVIERPGSNELFEVVDEQVVRLSPGGGTATVGLKREFGTDTPVCYIARRKGEELVAFSGRAKLGDATKTAATPGGEVETPVAGGTNPVPGEPGTPFPVEPSNPIIVAPARPVPLAAPATLPEAPRADKGTAAFTMEAALLAIAKAEYTELEKLVADDAEGDLALLRSGEIPVERANEIRQALFKMDYVGAESKSDGNRHFYFKSATGQVVHVVVRRRRGAYVVIDLELSGAAVGTGAPNADF